MAQPRRLANPTPGFFEESLSLVRVPKAHRWVRLHRAKHAPIHFGCTGDNRFDSPGVATLYLARQVRGSFVEVFCRTSRRRVTELQLRQYRVAEFQASRGLKLIDLAGKGLVAMGLDARLATGSYKLAQKWARAFHDHPDQPDGILYRSRHDPNQQLAALFERSQPILRVSTHGTLQDYLGDEFYAVLDHYEIALL